MRVGLLCTRCIVTSHEFTCTGLMEMGRCHTRYTEIESHHYLPFSLSLCSFSLSITLFFLSLSLCSFSLYHFVLSPSITLFFLPLSLCSLSLSRSLSLSLSPSSLFSLLCSPLAQWSSPSQSSLPSLPTRTRPSRI